ncbi:MAG: hypothetical protein BZY88_16410 [SAR202 cluster bacterium Io17-Chloro-G9]|nr:MAG: hypothetical protein BZY88_16410 [SAR202 cluster bacterium Io17-Chloro-G9]
MHIGLMMECDYQADRSQEQAFDDVFATASNAEDWGFDGVWLAERHFAPPGGVRPVPSVVASPLIVATAIAARTSRIRVGTAVLVLPLGHPVRMAEEVATIDNISQGRLDLGIGRSGLPWSYTGYDIPYSESRERFTEFFEVMRLAWTQEQFSYEGKYYNFQDVCLVPKPFQRPYPPLRYAATSRETFADMGKMGMPIFVGIGRSTVSDLGQAISEYRYAWKESGHPGNGDVMLRMGAYVAEDMDRAISDPRESTEFFYGRMQGALGQAPQSQVDEQSPSVSQSQVAPEYEAVLRDRLAYGTPDSVTHRLQEIIDELGLSGIIMMPNVGGKIPWDRLNASIRLFGEEVAPRLTSGAAKAGIG